jgi:predicted O-linked N-acetylglucosamine transferase (SPINDLY family)
VVIAGKSSKKIVGFEVLTAVSNLIALMMEAARASETLVNFYQTTQRYNPEDSHLLKRLFDLRKEVELFLINKKSDLAQCLQNVEWIAKLAYLSDIFFRNKRVEFKPLRTNDNNICCVQ